MQNQQQKKVTVSQMKKYQTILALLFSVLLLTSCTERSTSKNNPEEVIDAVNSHNTNSNLLKDFPPIHPDGDINVVIEIPSGTKEKWEVDKQDGHVKLELIDSLPRIVDYLGYPCNYGMIPRTYLSKALGGDGDPLDVIVLGAPIERGAVVKCKLIGVLYLTDHGEQDDKLIAVRSGSPFYQLNDLEALKDHYNGILEILQLWFTNYKGPGKIESTGYGDKQKAEAILQAAMNEYKNQ